MAVHTAMKCRFGQISFGRSVLGSIDRHLHRKKCVPKTVVGKRGFDYIMHAGKLNRENAGQGSDAFQAVKATEEKSERREWLREKHRRYMPGLDGLRAIAVFAVIFYHLGFPWASGGLLGVSVFFVLSGYLITDILISEWNERRAISLKTFWLRRARRLLPALFFVLIILFLWQLFFRPDLLNSYRKDAVAAIFYCSNWWYIFHHLSYFESYAHPSLLTHFWSLAVEEQFYVVWPLLILFVFRHPRLRRHIVLVTLIGAVLSAAAMGFIFQPGSDPSRVYYGTDTRAFSILIGAALAMVWPSRQLSDTLTRSSLICLNTAGVIGFLVMIGMMAFSTEYDAFVYRGGMFLLSLATAAVIAACAHPSSWIGKVLGTLPLRWIGLRSYGMYLWQFPIIMLSLNNFDAGVPRIARFFVEIVLIIVISTLSLKLIENPFRSGLVGRWLRHAFLNRPPAVRWRVTALAAGLFLLLTAGAWAYGQGRARPVAEKQNTPSQSVRAYNQSGQSEDSEAMSRTNSAKPVRSDSTPKSKATRTEASKPGKQKKDSNRESAKESDESASKTVAGKITQPVSIIGDSIMVDIKPYLGAKFANIVVNAREGRHFEEAPAIIDQLKRSGTLGKLVIVELGTNGPVTRRQISRLIKQIGPDAGVIVTTARVPRPWEDQVNQTMRTAASVYDNVRMADWYSASAGHREYFAPDTIHLNPDGSKAYTRLLYRQAAAFFASKNK
ncbi:MAG: acetyltransferase [Sporolactobacillus sp.]|jgi:peptidoglycan/LPS O-acetylase OafA/YrhL|nr:acetyltransferase [Sporolactobacillus sp.]